LVSVVFCEFGDLDHKVVGDLFMGSNSVAMIVEINKIDGLAKPDANLFAAPPIPHYLFWKIVSKAGDENRNNLRPGSIDHLSNTGLGGQKRVRIGIEVTLSFGMKPNYVCLAVRSELYKPP